MYRQTCTSAIIQVLNFLSTYINNNMATNKANKETPVLKLNLEKVHSEYLPALNLLYKMQRGSMILKYKIKTLREEINAKSFDALSSVREADGLRSVAKTAAEKAEAEARFQEQFDMSMKKDIEISSPKIPLSLFPKEEVLFAGYNDPVPQANGQILYNQGDYMTLVVSLFDVLIDVDIDIANPEA